MTKQKSGQRQAIEALPHFTFSPVALEPVLKPFCDERSQNIRVCDAPNTRDNYSQNLRNNDATDWRLAMCLLWKVKERNIWTTFAMKETFTRQRTQAQNGKNSPKILLL
ncbi:MAG: hypothetical protein Q7T32_11580 [Moraxellaceae bacterium]|nr:hypothetical protein [Moraxellaceae bacterium]